VLQNCFPKSIRRILNELPRSLDETYERVLKEIGMANRGHAHRLLQCLTVAIRPLRVEELAEILSLDFDEAEGATPTLNKDWRWEDRQRAVLSTCSSLITLVDDGDSRVIQFSHFSVKEFLTSDRLATSKGDISHFHITPEPAHTTLAQACLGTLLQLDGNLDNSFAEGNFPLARYASRNWVEHAQFGMVSSRIEDGMRRLFDSAKPYFAAWLQLDNIDDGWYQFRDEETADHGSPLYYASLCGFRDLAAHIIVDHPEQVNARGGLNHSPLVAALHKRHFDLAELLHQHGTAVDVPGSNNRTPLQAASVNGFIDVARWLLDHGADADLQTGGHWTPLIAAAANGHLEIVRMLLGYNVRINAATDVGQTPLRQASYFGYVGIVRLLLQHGADISPRDNDYSTPLHVASSSRRLEVARLLLDHVADIGAKNTRGRTPLHLASSSGGAEIVRLLLDRGANANAGDKFGWTPLHLASSKGKTETVRLLLDRGASADVKNNEGKTPLQVASMEGREIVDVFAEHGAQVDTRDSGL
jgi:ankyrin repeat protein